MLGIIRWADARVVLVAVTASFSVLFVASFESGMDDGDAGRPIGFFGGLPWWFALAGVICAGTTVALLTRVLLASGERLIPVVLGATAAVPLFFALMQPTVLVLVSLIALMALVIQSVRRRPADQTVADTREPDVAFAAVPSRSRVMGIIALAFVPVVWGIAGLVGIAEAGRPAATQSMGYGLALSPLAAIPLLLAIRGSIPRDVHRHLAVPVIGVGLGVAFQIVWWSPIGTAMYIGSAVTGVTIGCWLAFVTLPLLPATTAMKVVVGSGIVVASATAWFVIVTMTAGIGLVIAAFVAVILAPRRGRSAVSALPRA